MTTTPLTAEQLDKLYPISQITRTGKWGWRRVNGCLNLNTCSHPTRTHALLDRGQANQKNDLGSR